MNKFKEVFVLDVSGKPISKCTKKRANQLIAREAAAWVGYNIVQLNYNREQKKRFKQDAMERDNYTCYIPTCGKVMHKDHPDLSADHIRSRAKGGSDLPDNLACCCKPCNEEKGNMDLEDFLKLKLGLNGGITE